MLMVIFGAGASYDSSSSHRPGPGRPVEEDRPPLASELFENRPLFTAAMTRFRDCVPLVPKLRDLEDGVSVEEMLEQLYSDAAEYPARHRQFSAIRYYLHYMMWQCQQQWRVRTAGITNHVTLVDTIDRWRAGRYEEVCLVTFNYDTLIEHALDYNRVRIESIGDYVVHPVFKLIKVHGSVNWAREVRTPIRNVRDGNVWPVIEELIERADRLDLSENYQVVMEYPIGVLPGARPAIPALAIPLTTKEEFECPREHQEVLERCIPRVSKLLVIGWRGAERHFLRLFGSLRQESHVPGLVVAGSRARAKEVISHLQPAATQVRWEVFEGGFSEFVTSVAADRFLKS